MRRRIGITNHQILSEAFANTVFVSGASEATVSFGKNPMMIRNKNPTWTNESKNTCHHALARTGLRDLREPSRKYRMRKSARNKMIFAANASTNESHGRTFSCGRTEKSANAIYV